MADFGISIVEKLIESIGREAIKEVCDMWGYKSQLEDLKQTVFTIKQVLLDAEAKRQLTYTARNYIKELKDAVYDADDLFDEFNTLAELNELRQQHTKRGKLYEKVSHFFSSDNNPLIQAYKMSHEVKDIRKRLSGIADSRQKFGFGVDYKPISRRREETCSYVDANIIFGRDKDKEVIIGMLLDDHTREYGCVTIVGVGGLGKTALAQLVYNDDRIRKEFPDLRLWVCVSDQDGVPFDVKTILCKILKVAGYQISDSSSLQTVQHQFQESVRGKKYLLVLDDVWNEERTNWLGLREFLKLGQGGSRVVVTTRSKMTGTVISNNNPYELQGLSPENSRRLFEMSAFHDQGDNSQNHEEFVEMGKKIVAKCHSIPLALKVVGSLLYGQDISKWRSFEASGLAGISNGDNEIMSILKLSYHNLAPSLKNCFSYCALFHKDEVINKQMLIDLWMAQGYIIPLDRNQDIEDAAEEHFLILLRRCFFQDVKKDAYGIIQSVKIHDLIHDVSQEVGREEISVMTCNTMSLEETIRHVSYDSNDVLGCPLGSGKIRSFICNRGSKFPVLHDRQIVESCKHLRVLDLSRGGVIKLSKSIGMLLHLRYLDLSNEMSLQVLPDGITRLHNLQTLILYQCPGLKELPEDFCKLVKLRHLDLGSCVSLKSMPCGMDRLISLRVLPYFVVGNSKTNKALKDLKSLTGVTGSMWIDIGEDYKESMSSSEREGVSGEYLKDMKYLTRIEIRFQGRCDSNQEGVLENLQPPSNIKELAIISYKGKRIPKWGRAVDNWASSLSRLVNLMLDGCVNLEEMPALSKLPHLISLHLKELKNLEYMEMESQITRDEDELFFPSLVNLDIWGFKKLKGWWKEKSCGVVDDHQSCCSHNSRSLAFPCLSKLRIFDCPKLTSFPPCPKIQKLMLYGASNEMRLQISQSDDNTPTVESSEGKNIKKLQDLSTDNIIYLKSLPIQWLTHVTIEASEELEGPSQEELEACYFPPNPRFLRLRNFKEMKSLPAGIQFLTSLQTLIVDDCKKLEGLPEWISCLSSLNSLDISGCPAMKSLPQAMTKLTSLHSLKIWNCPELTKRCRGPDGEDRPKVQHIPRIIIRHRL